MTLERLAPAKVNLCLAVTGRRDDGYHELRSVFLRIGLSDRLSVSPAGDGATGDHLTVLDDPDCPLDGNLVLRAAELVRTVTRAPLPPVVFTLEKAIPVEAGLGGGSSDAAAALELACDAWGVGLDLDPMAIAVRLGADVPFFRAGIPAAEVSGIGNQVRPLRGPRGGVGILLVTPQRRLSTTRAFKVLDELEPPSTVAAETVEGLASALDAGMDTAELVAWTDRLADANDLWPAAEVVGAGIRRQRTELEASLGRRVLLSGSGPTFVALYPSAAEARQAGQRLAASLTPSLRLSRIVATDDIGPHPTWRYP